MGARGPVPKRSTNRRRRNKVDVDTVTPDDEVRGPELTNKTKHTPTAVRFYEALRRSGQSRFFEPSDWAAAELTVLAIDAFVERPSAVMLASINSAMSNLLATEGDRRRVRLELERSDGAEVDDDGVSELEEYRRRITG